MLKTFNLVKSCSNVAQWSKSCSKLLILKKVARNAKSCSKVAEHSLDMPNSGGVGWPGGSLATLVRNSGGGGGGGDGGLHKTAYKIISGAHQ